MARKEVLKEFSPDKALLLDFDGTVAVDYFTRTPTGTVYHIDKAKPLHPEIPKLLEDCHKLGIIIYCKFWEKRNYSESLEDNRC